MFEIILCSFVFLWFVFLFSSFFGLAPWQIFFYYFFEKKTTKEILLTIRNSENCSIDEHYYQGGRLRIWIFNGIFSLRINEPLEYTPGGFTRFLIWREIKKKKKQIQVPIISIADRLESQLREQRIINQESQNRIQLRNTIRNTIQDVENVENAEINVWAATGTDAGRININQLESVNDEIEELPKQVKIDDKKVEIINLTRKNIEI